MHYELDMPQVFPDQPELLVPAGSACADPAFCVFMPQRGVTALYIYSLKPPANPNPQDDRACSLKLLIHDPNCDSSVCWSVYRGLLAMARKMRPVAAKYSFCSKSSCSAAGFAPRR